jgi:LacI family transcriptional regulator
VPRKELRTGAGLRRALLSNQPVSQRMLADYLGLSPATVSLVMNRSPVADSIPQATQERIFSAARRFNYQPSFVARSLRTQRSFTIGVLVPEVSQIPAGLILSGLEDHLLPKGYLYLVASHRHQADLVEQYPRLLVGRSVDGMVAVDTPWNHEFLIPLVAISGRGHTPGASNIVLDHRRAAELALQHLYHLGHRRIAFLKGRADTEVQWKAICEEARKLGLSVNARLTAQCESGFPSPDPGFGATHQLLATGQPFTALFACNDVSAMGAIRALRETGRRVPEDVSVVGFDDLSSAAFQAPGLTSVRQPWRKMGEMAAEILLCRIASPEPSSYVRRIPVQPELAVGDSTGPAPARKKTGNGDR